MSAPYVVPVPAGYVAAYDTGRMKTVDFPVVAAVVADGQGTALVFNSCGRLVEITDPSLPGTLIGVSPAAWPKA